MYTISHPKYHLILTEIFLSFGDVEGDRFPYRWWVDQSDIDFEEEKKDNGEYIECLWVFGLACWIRMRNVHL